MNIHVSGCVVKAGEINAPSNCTLREAIELAGGINNNKNYQPTGIIVIRTRITGTKSELRKKVDFRITPSVLDGEIMQDNDIVIVQIDGEYLEKGEET